MVCPAVGSQCLGVIRGGGSGDSFRLHGLSEDSPLASVGGEKWNIWEFLRG